MDKKNKNIFLVEDDSAIVDIYKTLMEKSGFDVEVFGLGHEIIKAVKEMNGDLESKKPDIILLDLILPDMNGMEVLKEVRKNNATKNTKVFILTNQENVKFSETDTIKPDKVIIKANTTPTQLVEIIKEELG